jgi:hypothetical protein
MLSEKFTGVGKTLMNGEDILVEELKSIGVSMRLKRASFGNIYSRFKRLVLL